MSEVYFQDSLHIYIKYIYIGILRKHLLLYYAVIEKMKMGLISCEVIICAETPSVSFLLYFHEIHINVGSARLLLAVLLTIIFIFFLL